MRRAVFLDRDGTIIEDVGYLSSVDQIDVYPWSVEALRLLSDAGLALVIVTNQAGVARGFFDEALVADTHARLLDTLADAGIHVEAVYYCPHHPEGALEAYRMACECRKPQPGMLHRAANDLGLDLGASYVVGDRWSDVELARAVGAVSVLVRTGYGESALAAPRPDVEADVVAATLLEAARWIVAAARAPSETSGASPAEIDRG